MISLSLVLPICKPKISSKRKMLTSGGNLRAMITSLENFLIRKLLRSDNRRSDPAIQYAAKILVASEGEGSIRELARLCNMTIQTLEVRFQDQVGIDPKTFACGLRFGAAVKLKLYHPALTWTKVAHHCGFYDQMHLIKNFKRFTGHTPKVFMKMVNPPVEQFLPEQREAAGILSATH